MVGTALNPREITGLVLAGGEGQRMGQEKGLALLRGRALAWHALERLRPQVGPLALNANRCLDDYRRLGVPVWPDADPQISQGPLAGLLSGLRHCETPWLLTVPCDVPGFPTDLVTRLARAVLDQDCLLGTVRAFTPQDLGAPGGPFRQPVFCLAHRSLAEDLQTWLAAGGRKMGAWMARHPMAEAFFDGPQDRAEAFANLNTPQDLQGPPV